MVDGAEELQESHSLFYNKTKLFCGFTIAYLYVMRDT